MKQPKKMTHLPAEQTESGRSMVEMLGVLAIMGILSIGGIAGYTYAMNKLRANNTITYVNMLAIAGSQQAALGRDELTLGEFPAKTTDGYDADIYRLTDEPRYFDIDIAGVPRAVCTNILALTTHWRGLDSVWVNDNQTTCEQDENLMSFIFSETLGSDENGGSRCTQDSECSGCQTCVRGFCTDTDAACSGNTPYCVNGTCQGCHAGEFQDTKGKCYPCSGDTIIGSVDPSECDKCKGQRFSTLSYQRCVPCTYPGSLYLNKNDIDKARCNSCAKRYWMRYGSSEITCNYCDGMITSENDEQVCQGHCPAGQVWSGNKCVSCDSTDAILFGVSRESCRTICAGVRFPEITFAQCTRCDAPLARQSTQADCAACPNNYWRNDFCYYCNGTVIHENNAQICQGHCPAGQVWNGSKCVACDSSDTVFYTVYGPDCARQCKGVRFSRSEYSACFRCDKADDQITNDKESCLACGNRTWKNGTCSFCAGTVSADGTTCE